MEDNRQINLLITGCAGFIGSHAIDHFLKFKSSYNIVGVDCLTYASKKENIVKKDFKFYKEDICNTKSIKKICLEHNIDWIINFAAETHVDNSIENSKMFIHSNVEGVRSLLDVCKDANIKILHISTDEVYGSIAEGEFDELSKFNPRNPYSATKAAAEHLVKSYSNTYGIEYLIVRPSNNMGARQHIEKFLPKIISCISENKKVPIYGDGLNIREWLYAKDTCRAIEYILRHSKINEVYNISSKIEMKNIEVVSYVCERLNKKLKDCIMYVDDRKGHDFRYAISNKKLSDLGFSKYTSFEKALIEIMESYE